MTSFEQEFLNAVDGYMDDFADRILQLSQENIIKDGKADTGFLLKSGNINRSFLNKEIIYTAPYADNVEFGRVPGTMPPVDALVGWVRRKLRVKDSEARGVAWAIAQSIKQKGTDPSPFIQPAISQAKREFGLK